MMSFFSLKIQKLAQYSLLVKLKGSFIEETVPTDGLLAPPAGSLRGPDIRYNGSELSCLDRPRLREPASRACCQCPQDSAQPCGKPAGRGPPGGPGS